MLDILRDYMVEAADPVNFDAVRDAHSQFERIGLENYEQDFETLLMTNENVDAGETVIYINQLTTEFQAKILEEHGVRLNDPPSMPVATTIIRGLLDLQNFEGKTDVIRAAQSAPQAEEALCEVLALVTDKSAEELLVEIEFVSGALIQRIIEQAEAEQPHENDDEETIFRRQRVNEFRRFCEFVGTNDFEAYKILQRGVDVGFPFTVYARLIDRDFERFPVETAAINLVALCLISSDMHDTIQAGVADHIDEFIANPDTVTKVTIAVTDLLVRFQQAGAGVNEQA